MFTEVGLKSIFNFLGENPKKKLKNHGEENFNFSFIEYLHNYPNFSYCYKYLRSYNDFNSAA